MTTDDEFQAVCSALEQVPFLAGTPSDQLKVERLYSLTNKVFRVHTPDSVYCVRLPGAGTESYIDRNVEQTNAVAAAQAGVSPEVLHFDEQAIMITPFLEGTTTMSPETFRTRHGAPKRAGEAFAKLHSSGPVFAFRFELFSMIDDYLAHLGEMGVTDFPEGYHALVEQADGVRAALAMHDLPLVACHCDPMCENMLDDGDRMWIIDWEYSGNNDPMWDLGDMSVEAGFDESQDMEMLVGYFQRKPTDFEHGRMVIYKALCDLLWTLWGLVQHANDNPADDFEAYAIQRFERCRNLMTSPEFARHLRAVEAG